MTSNDTVTLAKGTGTVANVLEEDPDLGARLGPERQAEARERTQAPVLQVARGEWSQQEWPATVEQGLGLLVLDGLLLRRVDLEGRYGVELLGQGDLLRPWQREDALASVPRRAGWQALSACRIALLDVDFAMRIRAYPEIHAELLARAIRRTRYLAVNMAIVHQPRVRTRVHMLLWHLADRWGTVRGDGVLVAISLTHQMLSELVAARRPTVSAALSELEREGLVSRVRGGWLVHGAPPGELPGVNLPQP